MSGASLSLVTFGRDGILFPTQNVKSESDRAVIVMTGGDRDDDWQDEAGSLLCYLSPIAVLAHQRGASNGSQNQHDLRQAGTVPALLWHLRPLHHAGQ